MGIPDNDIAPADGAFYIYVDLARSGVDNAEEFCLQLLEDAGVAISPGTDFEDPSNGLGTKRVRFSYSRSTEEVSEGMQRFSSWYVGRMLGIAMKAAGAKKKN